MLDSRTKQRKVGDLGERMACKFLRRRGFEIVETNYLRKWGEIDIVAEKGGRLHFVEVKSVSHSPVSHEKDDYRPEDNLHPWKLKRLSRTIQTYLLGHDASRETDWQFDVVTVFLDMRGKKASFNYLENVIL